MPGESLRKKTGLAGYLSPARPSSFNPTMESVLWTRDIGIKLLEVASGMMCLGILAIRKLMNVDI